ncbi:MAG TPA: hypothetical protein VM889_06095 [Candidatus Thermoplasmatota archaeon]|nr:hypothetical protein [Candidatus Thermoplasmatota archaeon]
MKALIAALLAALVAAPLVAPFASAQDTAGGGGFAISPAELRVPNALLRGGYYEATMRLQNSHDHAVTITPSGAGAIASWIRTDPAEPFSMAPATSRTLRVMVTVPEDAANGPYEGAVRIDISGHGAPTETGSVASVNMAFAPAVKLSVSGDQVRRLAFERARVLDAEAGQPVTFVFDVVNTGNVRAAPSFAVAIEDAEGRKVHEETLKGLEIAPGVRSAIALKTSRGLAVGAHEATAALVADGEPRPREGLAFEIHPAGTLSRSEGKSGQLAGLSADARPRAGSLVKVTGVFASDSTRAIDAARLVGEVSRDGARVALLAGDGLAVLPGTSRPLDAYWTPTEPGVYRVKVWATYDGLETEAREIDLIVEPPAGGKVPPTGAGTTDASGASAQKPKGIPGPGALAILGLAGAAAWAIRRRA